MKFDKIIEEFKNDGDHDISNYDESVLIMACGYRREKDELVTGVTIDKEILNDVYYGESDKKLPPIDIGIAVSKLMVREAICTFKEYASEDGYVINEFDVTDLMSKILKLIDETVLVKGHRG